MATTLIRQRPFSNRQFARYDGVGSDKNIRLGRFEFFEGLETKPKNPTTNRVAQRLVGNLPAH